MEKKITLDLLVNFLTSNERNVDLYSIKEENIVKDNFNLNYLEFYNSSNFNKFNDIFNNNVDRVGVYYKIKNMNVSFLSSLLFCIDDDYCTLDSKEQSYYIKLINRKIINDTNSRKFKVKKLSSKMIISNIKNYNTINDLDIYIYSAYFKVNIFIFDFVKGYIKAYYPDNELNIYKNNIFISKKNDKYHPLVYKNNNGKLFRYNSSILENIIYNQELNVFSLNEKEFIICNNWDILLENYNNQDFRNIVIDLPKDSNMLLQQMIDSDSEEENIDYDDSESNIDFDNLTEELEKINNEAQMLNNSELSNNYNDDEMDIDSDEIILSDNFIESSNINEEMQTLIKKLKDTSSSKLLKEKKDILIGYITQISNKKKSEFKSKTKKQIVNSIESELQKNI